jgi:flagellar motor switch protein FliN/FliY
MGKAAKGPSGPTTEVKAVDFAEMQRGQSASGAPQLDQLTEVKFEAEAILGRTVLTVGEILNLGAGSVIELNRQIAEPVDLVIQGVKVASGEVVVVDDCFAIRIKEIVQPSP